MRIGFLDYAHLVDQTVYDEGAMGDLQTKRLASYEKSQSDDLCDCDWQLLIVDVVNSEFKPRVTFKALDDERQSFFEFNTLP
jgi:hypothetical protein